VPSASHKSLQSPSDATLSIVSPILRAGSPFVKANGPSYAKSIHFGCVVVVVVLVVVVVVVVIVVVDV